MAKQPPQVDFNDNDTGLDFEDEGMVLEYAPFVATDKPYDATVVFRGARRNGDTYFLDLDVKESTHDEQVAGTGVVFGVARKVDANATGGAEYAKKKTRVTGIQMLAKMGFVELADPRRISPQEIGAMFRKLEDCEDKVGTELSFAVVEPNRARNERNHKIVVR